MAVTLADVAKRAGVSVATASRVLNNKMVMPIPPTTVARIKQAAEELQYLPNAIARALATGKTRTLGLYSQEMTDPHFAQMLEAAEAKARSLGFHLIVSSTLEEVSWRGRVDGIVALGAPDQPQFEGLADRLSTVFVFHASQPKPNLVAWSDEEGMYLATRHLLELGHRKIAALFCYGEERSQPKVAGFRRAIAEEGAESIECWQAYKTDQTIHGNQFENGYRSVQQLCQERRDFTGLVARNDFLALGALRALRAAGAVVPEDVSVIGYTDSIHAVCADPPLTSVRTPIAEAGEMAIERLVRSIEGKEADFEGVLLPTTLTVRHSCAPPSERAR